MDGLGSALGGMLTGLREGVEAALIIGIVAGYLVKIGRADRLVAVWAGVIAAVIVSAVAAIGSYLLLGGLDGVARTATEAIASLLAVCFLTYMLFWMRRQASGISAELRGGVDRALAATSIIGLGGLAFTAVIREGIETALFLLGQATVAGGAGASVFAGALIGLLLAVGIGIAIFQLGMRLNLSAFFRVTGIALIVVAAGLLGYSAHEFVELGFLPAIFAPAYDLSATLPHDSGLGAALRALVGYSATPELSALLLQLSYLLLGLVFYLRPLRPAAQQRP
jgi:high-affinity iron transporter